MTPLDLAVRNATYRLFAAIGRAPSVEEVAAAVGEDRDVIAEAWRRLHDEHALVLADPGADPAALAIRMANPFSALETPHRVESAGRTWFANCGWDAFGIGVVLGADSTIHTTCPDCREPIDLVVRSRRPVDPEPVFHVLVAARDWWADIGFT